jgi:23S rRNA pseudouridine1911/1915/1917 synthase
MENSNNYEKPDNYSPAGLKQTIPAGYHGRELLAYLRNELKLSRSLIRALKISGGIRLNGQVVFVNHRLVGGEKLQLTFAPLKQSITPESGALEIVYEDSDLVVVNKPAGMVVHPVKKHQSGTLANLLIGSWQERGEMASFHPVHRLDRWTSGLVLIAKNAWVHQQFDLALKKGGIRRLYLAICQGAPAKTSGRITAPVKDLPETARRIVHTEGRPALTRYRILRRFPSYNLLLLKLYTGRTHQIRVHLAHLGHPLLGDSLYGGLKEKISRPALHAVRLSFCHPRSGKLLRFTAPLPEDMQRLMNGKPESGIQ